MGLLNARMVVYTISSWRHSLFTLGKGASRTGTGNEAGAGRDGDETGTGRGQDGDGTVLSHWDGTYLSRMRGEERTGGGWAQD